MFKNTPAFSSFSVKDLTRAKKFYVEVLGLDVSEDQMGLTLKLANGHNIFVYQKDNHQPATYTILNFQVKNIDQAVSELKSKGIQFEHYPEMTEADGIARGLSHNMGPDIAWFKDPDGNFLAVLQNEK